MAIGTIITCAQVAISIYNATKPSDSGLGDLLAAQTRMLMAIQNQLNSLGELAAQIYTTLQEIEEDIDVLPIRVSEKVYQFRTSGAMLECSDIVSEFNMDVEIEGDKFKARQLMGDRPEQKLRNLNSARSTLMSIQNSSATATLCNAFDVELLMLTNLVDLDLTRILNTLESYERWFRHCKSETLESEIDTLSKKVEERLISTEGYRKHLGQRCVTNVEFKELFLELGIVGHVIKTTCDMHTYNVEVLMKDEIIQDMLSIYFKGQANGCPVFLPSLQSFRPIELILVSASTKDEEKYVGPSDDARRKFYADHSVCPAGFIDAEGKSNKEMYKLIPELESLMLLTTYWLLCDKYLERIGRLKSNTLREIDLSSA